MGKRTIYKRNLDNVGRDKYRFDFRFEKCVYKYLCMNRLNRREKKRLTDEVKFVYYRDWKDYICRKYKDYSKEDLQEFSRYLQQRTRGLQPGIDYWKGFVSGVLALMLSSVANGVVFNKFDLQGNKWCGILLMFIMELVVIVFIFAIVYITMSPMYEMNTEYNLCEDYKEIIDGLLAEISTLKVDR